MATRKPKAAGKTAQTTAREEDTDLVRPDTMALSIVQVRENTGGNEGSEGHVSLSTPGPSADGDRQLPDYRALTRGKTVKGSNNFPAAPHLTGEAARRAKVVYLEALSQSGLESTAMIAAGITPSQVERFRAEDPSFNDLESLTRLHLDDVLRRRVDVMGAINPSVLVAAMKRLPEYNPVKKTEVEVKGTIKHVAGLPEAELDRIIREGAELIVDAEFEEIEQ